MSSISMMLASDYVDKNEKCSVKIVLYHQSRRTVLKELAKIDPRDWDEANRTIKMDARGFKDRIELFELLDKVVKYQQTLRNMSVMENIRLYNIKELKDKILKACDNTEADKSNVYSLIEEYCVKRNLSVKSVESFQTLTEKLKDFTKKSELRITEIDHVFLEDLDAWMRRTGNRVNTVAVYMRNLRTLCNYAIRKGLLSYDGYPFRMYKIKTESTKHRTIQVTDMRKLIKYNGTAAENVARDLFMLSFYLRGMNFKDLLYLKKKDVYGGRIYYQRSKTQSDITVKIEPEAQEIFDRYKGKKHLLYFIQKKEVETEKRGTVRKTELHADIVNRTSRRLKKVFEKLNINVNVSTYFARHTWATMAREFGDYDIVQQGLGHADGRVTATYIQYSEKEIDKTNRKVIDHVWEGINKDS